MQKTERFPRRCPRKEAAQDKGPFGHIPVDFPAWAAYGSKPRFSSRVSRPRWAACQQAYQESLDQMDCDMIETLRILNTGKSAPLQVAGTCGPVQQTPRRHQFRNQIPGIGDRQSQRVIHVSCPLSARHHGASKEKYL